VAKESEVNVELEYGLNSQRVPVNHVSAPSPGVAIGHTQPENKKGMKNSSPEKTKDKCSRDNSGLAVPVFNPTWYASLSVIPLCTRTRSKKRFVKILVVVKVPKTVGQFALGIKGIAEFLTLK